MSFISNQIQFSFLDYPTQDWCISVYFIGCEHYCLNCHNPELASIHTCNCIEIDREELKNKIITHCNRYRTRKVCFLGGDPLHENNREDVKYLICQKEYDVCIYTGYEFNKCVDIVGYEYLKCGKYIEQEKQIPFKDDFNFVLGSKNQKLYNRNNKCISDNGIVKMKGITCN